MGLWTNKKRAGMGLWTNKKRAGMGLWTNKKRAGIGLWINKKRAGMGPMGRPALRETQSEGFLNSQASQSVAFRPPEQIHEGIVNCKFVA